MAIVWCFSLLFLDAFTAGSVIVFTASPATVVQGLTDHTALRCGLNDTAASASVIGRRDTQRTPTNVLQVSSIIIMQNGLDVASVTQGSVKRLVNATNVHATGDVSAAAGERGFLELALQYPAPSQLGEYQCEITAVGASGHGVIFKTNVEINVSPPTIADLVNEIHNAKNREREQDNLILTLQQTDATQQHTISKQQQTISSLQTQIKDLQSDWSAPSNGLQVRLLTGLVGPVWGRDHGAVQLRYNGQSGMLCDDHFDQNNNGATVVCRMLGYSGGVYVDGNNFLGTLQTAKYKDMYLLNNVICTGSEADLTQCRHRNWAVPSLCSYDELAGVQCSA